MANIGFIGTGIMGLPMAQNLLKAGHTLFLSSHHKAPPMALTEAGAHVLSSPKEVAQQAEFIIVMLPDTPFVDDVLFAENGVAEGVGDGKVVIDMSSISPSATKAFAEKIIATGARYLDAPVSGGEVGAKAGSLSIMVGGDQEVFERALPLFQSMGKNITLVGGNGDGQTAKVANQIIVALNIQAVSEALLFAARNGADPAKVREALMGGFASSKILEVHGERMIKGTFDPGFRISLHQKDLNLALEGARELNLNLPNTANAQQVFSTCAALGGSQWDHSALIKGLEHMANFSIRPGTQGDKQ
jgi:2-hydroxy-3-oxopropionate reductase